MWAGGNQSSFVDSVDAVLLKFLILQQTFFPNLLENPLDNSRICRYKAVVTNSNFENSIIITHSIQEQVNSRHIVVVWMSEFLKLLTHGP